MPSAESPPDLAPLLRPLTLRGRQLPNRIVFGAHLTNFGVGRTFGPRHMAYYRERAAGGAGMIVTEALTVHPQDYPYEHAPRGETDAIVPPLAALAESLRAAAPAAPPLVVAQLNHTGGQCAGRLLRQSPWAPSPVADVASKRMAREMSHGQIEEVIAGFAAAAGRVRAAGLDGVELSAGQHALLRQFLSPLTNFRQDEWGGEQENRLRLAALTVAAVRERLGDGLVLGLKLCGDELAPWGGITPEQSGAISAAVVAPGHLDYLSMQIGGPYSAHLTDGGMPLPEGYGAWLAAEVREAIAGRVPVFAEGRVEDPAAAARLLAEGGADGVVMTRALITDPALPRKVAMLDEEPIRPHIGMARYYSVRGDWNRPLGDLLNPRAGNEAALPPVRGSDGAGAALVIGGGPAGLEAAVTLARQGRRVKLVEAAAELGGMAVPLAAGVEARREFDRVAAYYRQMLARLTIEVETGRPVETHEPWMDDFQTIYLATGARAAGPPFPVDGAIPCLPPRALLLGEAPPARETGAGEPSRAVVVDGEHGFRMAAAVEWLLEQGYAVDVVSEDFFVGRGLVESAELLWFNRVAERGAVFHPRTAAVALTADGLLARDRFSGLERRFAAPALVVNALPEVPADDVLAKLEAAHPAVFAIGDARAPRLMGEAIAHAHRVVITE